MSAQIVVDISSDEEDNATKSSTKTRSTMQQPTNSTRAAVKSPSRTSPPADKPAVPATVTANCSETPLNKEPKKRTADTCPTQTEQEAARDQASSAPQTAVAASASSNPTIPTSTPEQDPPKPTPLDINEFRHLVSAGSVPVKDSPLILSIQPALPASNNKRKAPDTLEDQPSSRPRLSPLPPTPYTGTSEHPVPPKTSNNSVLWSVPAYKPPPPSPSSAAPTTQSYPNKPAPSALLEQPSIPNIHAPLTSTSPSTLKSTPKSTSTITTTTNTTTTIQPQTPTTTSTKPTRHRDSKWTGAQLANLASALEAAFFPTIDAFAEENKKTGRQVRDTFSFLVGRRIFEYSDEAGGEGGRNGGRGRGRGKVARRFEREMRDHRKQSAKTMKRVHAKEAGEAHWASEGMSEPKMRRGRKKGGVLEGVVG